MNTNNKTLILALALGASISTLKPVKQLARMAAGGMPQVACLATPKQMLKPIPEATNQSPPWTVLEAPRPLRCLPENKAPVAPGCIFAQYIDLPESGLTLIGACIDEEKNMHCRWCQDKWNKAHDQIVRAAYSLKWMDQNELWFNGPWIETKLPVELYILDLEHGIDPTESCPLRQLMIQIMDRLGILEPSQHYQQHWTDLCSQIKVQISDCGADQETIKVIRRILNLLDL